MTENEKPPAPSPPAPKYLGRVRMGDSIEHAVVVIPVLTEALKHGSRLAGHILKTAKNSDKSNFLINKVMIFFIFVFIIALSSFLLLLRI